MLSFRVFSSDGNYEQIVCLSTDEHHTSCNQFKPIRSSQNLVWTIINNHSQTSRKRTPKIWSLGSPLREVIAYESLDHIGSKFCLVSIRQLHRLTHVLNVLFKQEVNFGEKSGTSHWEISASCTIQECDNVTTRYHPISSLLSVKW